MSNPTDEQYAMIGKIAASWAVIDNTFSALVAANFEITDDRQFEFGQTFRARYNQSVEALDRALTDGRLSKDAAAAVEALKLAKNDALIGRNAVIHGLFVTPEDGEAGWQNPGTGILVLESELQPLLDLSRHTEQAAVWLTIQAAGRHPPPLGPRPVAPRLGGS